MTAAKKRQRGKKRQVPPEEYASLKEDFAKIIEKGIDNFQEKAHGRQIENITLRLQGTHGFIVRTNKRGLIEIPEMSGMELDNQGRPRRQRMSMGVNCNASTMKTTFGSAKALKPGETIVREFELNTGAHELVKIVTEFAQRKGEEFKLKVDNKEAKFWPRFDDGTAQDISANWDTEGVPSIDHIFDLITLAKQTLKTELGSKLAQCQIVFFHIVDTMELANTAGTKVDLAIPRTGFVIQAVTKKNSYGYDSIRGVGGIDAILRHNPDWSLEETIVDLARRISRYCIDLDRADPSSVLGGEAHIILSGELTGTMAHEVYGHVSEADSIIANKNNKNVELNLKARIGSQVSENTSFNIIDAGSLTVQLGNKTITNCFGAIPVDSNGTNTNMTELVKNGIQTLVLNSPGTFYEVMHGLSEDVKKNIEAHGLTGNYRNASYDKRPMVRMTNTFVLPDENGPRSIEEMAAMIPKTKKGVYLVTCKGGWVQLETGQFEVTGDLGYLIENGAITDKPVKDVIISGNISKFGSKIKAIGSSETIQTSTGYCGRGDSYVPVEDGGPAILIEDASIGEEKPQWYWEESFKEYKRQMTEVSCKHRKKSEVHFRFVEDATSNKADNHFATCMFNRHMPPDTEIDLICGKDIDVSEFIIGANGKLEKK